MVSIDGKISIVSFEDIRLVYGVVGKYSIYSYPI